MKKQLMKFFGIETQEEKEQAMKIHEDACRFGNQIMEEFGPKMLERYREISNQPDQVECYIQANNVRLTDKVTIKTK